MIEFEGKEYSENKVIETLQPMVTSERWEKIQKVVKNRNPHLVTVMENIYNRGNTSAVIRSAEAFGFYKMQHIVLQDEFKDSNRVSQGAEKWMVQKNWSSTRPCIESLKSQGFTIYVTHLEGGRPMEELPFDRPVALCFGNEKEGASQELTELADEKVFIPMVGFVQSFNISVAAALSFQHISKIHLQNPLPPLCSEKSKTLLAQYLIQACNNPQKFLS